MSDVCCAQAVLLQQIFKQYKVSIQETTKNIHLLVNESFEERSLPVNNGLHISMFRHPTMKSCSILITHTRINELHCFDK